MMYSVCHFCVESMSYDLVCTLKASLMATRLQIGTWAFERVKEASSLKWGPSDIPPPCPDSWDHSWRSADSD